MHQRHPASPGSLTPVDIDFGRADLILNRREVIKRKTMLTRRLRHDTETA